MTDKKNTTENKTIVIEVTPHTGPHVPWFHKSSKFPISIGRAYDNDLIINDPYVCEQHLKISRNPKKGWKVKDLGSENGFHLNSSHPPETSLTGVSGDRIKIGQTTLRIYSENHPVPATERFVKPHGITNWLSNVFFAWIIFFVATSLFVFWEYLDTWSKNITENLASTAAATVAIIMIWSVNWALTGKIFKHKANFTAQIAVCSCFAVLLLIVDSFEAYLSFLTNDSLTSTIITTVLDVALFSGLIFGCLSFATEMKRRKRALSAGLFAAGIIIGFVSFDIIKSNQFRSPPYYSDILKPHLSSWAPSQNIDDFMMHNQKLFDEKMFKEKKKQ